MKRVLPILTSLLAILLSVGVSAEEPRVVVSGEGSEKTISLTDITPGEETTPRENSDYMVGDYYPIEVKTTEDGNIRLVIKTFLVPPDVPAAALIEENLVRRGVQYEVSDVLRREISGTTENKMVSQTISTPVDKNEEALALAALAPSISYDEDGFSGTLMLERNTLTIRESGSENYAYTLKDIREYNGLERNDPYYVPKTAEKNGITLSLADIQWTPMGSGGENSDGSGLYRATATYTGRATGSRASGYTATATYSGEVSQTSEGSILFSIVYESVPAATKTSYNGALKPALFGISAVLLIALVTAVMLYFVRRGKEAVEAGVAEPDYQDPYTGRPAMNLPQMLDDMDRGIEGDDEK